MQIVFLVTEIQQAGNGLINVYMTPKLVDENNRAVWRNVPSGRLDMVGVEAANCHLQVNQEVMLNIAVQSPVLMYPNSSDDSDSDSDK